jgi:glycosyltransferase involved in cell wall biosynthesis
MRILVISQLPPFWVGGAERQAGRLIAEWRRQGHEVIAFGRGMPASEIELGGFRVPVRGIRTVQRFGRLLRGLSYVLSLSLLLLRYRRWPQAIYCRFLGEAAVTVALLKRLRLVRAPLVAVPANAGPDGDTAFLRSAPLRGLIAPLLERGCEAINLIAPQMAEDLRAFGLSGRQFHHIPNGITLGPVPVRQWHGERQLLTVCRLTDQKGVDVLLDALKLVQADDLRWHLRIVGDGPRRARLMEQAVAAGLTGRVEFAGVASEEDVRRDLARSHVFVLPSRFEGFSNAALEAMESGMPVLVTRCGGLDTYLRSDMGWVVRPGDVAGLAVALRAALTTPDLLLEAMGRRCRSEVEAKFDLRAVASRNLELFASLA